MGLDMYLNARRRVDEDTTLAIAKLTRWKHTNPDELEVTDRVIDLGGLRPLVGKESNAAAVYYIPGGEADVEVGAAYWRKANAVHAWFVDHVQDGTDDCGEYEVHPEQLAALALTCERALAAYANGDTNEAAMTMGPRSGFFFGCTDLDEGWAADMASTATEIRRCIHAAIAVKGVTFYYQSSW